MSILLAIDTALQRAVVALGSTDGTLIGAATWVAGHRHGEELLPRLQALLASNGRTLTDVDGVIVGTGPGAFTGLRVGIATAKAIASGRSSPIIGVPTAEALLAAEESPAELASPAGAEARSKGRRQSALLLPAGPSDRVLVLDGRAALLPAGADLPDGVADDLVAVDLPDRAPEIALARGERAVAGLAVALIRIGGARFRAGRFDDLARLVPEYVTLPRGVTSERGEVEWSHGLR